MSKLKNKISIMYSDVDRTNPNMQYPEVAILPDIGTTWDEAIGILLCAYLMCAEQFIQRHPEGCRDCAAFARNQRMVDFVKNELNLQ